MKNLFAISFIYFFINSVYCQSLEQIIAKNKKLKGNKPYTIRGYRPYHNTQKVIKGFNVFKLGELQKQDLYKIKSDCDTIYEGFPYSNYRDGNGIYTKHSTEGFLNYMEYTFDFSTFWWSENGYDNFNDLITIIDDFDVYYIKNYKFNNSSIDISLLFYQNLLIEIVVIYNESSNFKKGFELKNNIYNLNTDRYELNTFKSFIYGVYGSKYGTSFYDKKYLGYEGLIEQRMTKINKQNFINNNNKLKDY